MMRWFFIGILSLLIVISGSATPAWADTTPDLVVAVTDFAEQPLAGVTVIVREGAQEVVGVTDAQGRAEIVGVTQEHVRVELRGFIHGIPLTHPGDDAYGIRITRTAGTVVVELVVDGASGQIFPAASMFALEPIFLPEYPTISADAPGLLVGLPTADAVTSSLQFPEDPTFADTLWDATMDVPRPQRPAEETGWPWGEIVRGVGALLFLVIFLVTVFAWSNR